MKLFLHLISYFYGLFYRYILNLIKKLYVGIHFYKFKVLFILYIEINY